MHKQLRGVISVLLGSLLLFGAGPLWAQSQSSFAEALYQEGQQLMAAGRYAEACPKLAESYKLEPGAGTLLNLAACNEQLGKTATAWSQFSEVFHLLSTDEQRAAYAQEHRDSLATKLSRLAIQVPEASRVPGLVVKLDGVAVGTAGWGVAMPIDPGPHKLDASAQGYEPWQGSVEIAATAESKSVEIPALKALPGNESAQADGAASGDAGGTPKEGGRPITTPVKIAGVATIALAVGAGVTGGLYLSKRSKYNEINGSGADPDEIESRKSAVDTMGIVNLALAGGAVAGAATTLILYFTTPKEEPQTAFLPWVGAGAAGGTLVRRF